MDNDAMTTCLNGRPALLVIYTWKMDFNRSLLGAVTLLVPMTTPPPASSTMPTWAHNSWVCLFAAMPAVAIGGNVIVIWIVTAHRRMRTVTNYFLANLSFADLMMSSLNCLFNFIYMLHSDWVFGVRYCKLSNFIANVTVAASVFTLTGISFDRYQAIVRPMRPRMSKTCSLITIAAIWVSGMLLAILCLLYSTTKKYRSKGTLKTACLLSWPDGLPDVSYMDFVYQVPFFVVTYAVPMLGMTFFYSGEGAVGISLNRRAHTAISRLNTLQTKDCKNVHPSHSDIWHLLAAVPLLLHLHPLQPINIVHEVRAAYVPWFLLAGDGERYGRPDYILLDECQVSDVFPDSDPLPLERHMLAAQAIVARVTSGLRIAVRH